MVAKRLNFNANWRWLIPPLIIAILLLVFSGTLVHLTTENWWFSAIGFSEVFWTLLTWRSITWVGTFVIFALFLSLNYWFAMRVTRYSTIRMLDQSNFSFYADRAPKYIAPILIFFISLAAAGTSMTAWDTLLRFLNATEFNQSDPIYGRDLSFYVFELPFYQGLQGWLFGLLLMGLFIAGVVYVIKGSISFARGWQNLIEGEAKAHLCLLLAGLAFLIAFQFWLQRYDLLFSREGVVTGAGFTDVHARLTGLTAMGFMGLGLGVIFIASATRNTLILPLTGIGLYLGVYILLYQVYPSVQQQVTVDPNELAREREYIEHNIDFTRQGYNLSDVGREDFPPQGRLDRADIAANQETIRNIRLWDYRPILSTYRQLQEIRPYYSFLDVDVDRYTIDDNYRQVMLSSRELPRAPQQRWISERLKYTHGFGLVMSPVNQATSEGLPSLIIRDIPPVSNVDLDVEQPRVYYGEATNNYIFTGMVEDEFDYPLGNENAANRYDGAGGVPINSLWRRLLYSYNLGSFRVLISEQFTSESRIHYHRNIRERIHHVAPFLRLDSDPYVSLVDGRLKWIVEGYTISNNYPYSEPVTAITDAGQILGGGSNEILEGGFNYVRNSVKAVVDAYDGSMELVVVDEADPIIQTYEKIFPNLFTSIEDVSPELQSHFRYPLDLFNIQAQMYLEYHMTSPEVFYNQEDLWRFALENYEGSQQLVEPYYTIMRLPGEETEEFVLILPFTPVERDNMIAWMAARSDGENYGKLLLYEFPKQSLTYGPRQIEARIDQNTEISQQLSLWDQQGSRVIRGNLLVIPIEESLLYVEPIYLRADQGELPQLRRVVVSHGDDLVMRESIEEAVTAIFGEESPDPIEEEDPEEEPLDEPLEQPQAEVDISQDLVRRAREVYQEAQEAAQAGNWGEYGEKIEELEGILEDLNQESNND
ncbi:UPF0182 family protein [Euhalothece natronophila Z-M001]|uniref:UPF0182 protein FRE64_05825 n=1 Tax=Euhalothece natronophila Z-M001 TaxID=522448 RepID=A0A5B8NK94_9CHRO|nr:UPF0182 family protein [Euhalothece natronophila]QDZ39484.1 UPF0182 family protein [Euhalothece natronophila Z-M001]